MKFIIAIGIISAIINIVSYFIQKREVNRIKISFNQLRSLYRSFRDREK